VLSIAKTQAMADIGLIIITGVTMALITALVLVPSLLPEETT
jgi:predicted RND superfamily exporter protein